jgi:hypothetical protein
MSRCDARLCEQTEGEVPNLTEDRPQEQLHHGQGTVLFEC